MLVKMLIRLFICCSLASIMGCENLSSRNSIDRIKYPALLIKDSFHFPLMTKDLLANIDFFNFQGELVENNNQSWICYLTQSKKKLLFINLHTGRDSFSIPIDTFIEYSNSSFLFQDGILYIYDPYRSTISLKELSNQKLINLYTKQLPLFLEPNKYYLKQQVPFKIYGLYDPYVIINFGSLVDKKNSYLHKNYNLMLLSPGLIKCKMIGKYPSDFFKRRNYYTSSVFDIDMEENIIMTYELNNSIYKIDSYGNVLKESKVYLENSFLKFDWSKERDLSYVRKYSFATEKNIHLKCLDSNNNILIKQLPGNTILSNIKYQYIILDKNLKVRYTDNINFSCYPKMVMKYQNGFLLFNDHLTKAYYYEIP